jgi:hypothetical protein
MLKELFKPVKGKKIYLQISEQIREKAESGEGRERENSQ